MMKTGGSYFVRNKQILSLIITCPKSEVADQSITCLHVEWGEVVNQVKASINNSRAYYKIIFTQH